VPRAVRTPLQVGSVGGWRYLVCERDGGGVFAIVRRDIDHDILEDEIGFCYSHEVAEVLATALIAYEQRKIGLRRNSIST
jgi:hypothetical protein